MLPTQGGHSWVHFVKTPEGKVVVCKTFRLREHYKKEVQAFHAILQHPHVICPLEIKPEKRSIIFPDYSKTHVELLSLIQQHSIDDLNCIELAYQLCQAVAHLHKHNVAHLDIKPDNCLAKLYPKAELILIDLSLSATNQTSFDADWWDVGNTCFAMFYNTPLVQKTPSAKHGDFEDLQLFLLHGSGSLLSWPKFTVYARRRPLVDLLWPFLNDCLHKEPAKRPSKDTYKLYFGGMQIAFAKWRSAKRAKLDNDDIFVFE